MIAAWMLYCVGIGLAFVVAGHAIERALHLAGRQTRWAWCIALGGSLVLPAAAWLLPEAFSTVPVPLPQTAASEPVGIPAPGAAEQPAVPLGQPERAFSLSDLDGALRWGWGVSSGALLLGLAAAALRLSALRRRWRASLVDGRRVLVSENVGPAVAGLWRPRIVVPGWALQLTERQRELMLAHEEEHVRAGDPQLLAWGALALVAAPWNPALWWQVRRLRLAVEMDCDARVLGRAGPAPEYGELLLHVGRRRAQLALGAPALGEPISFLEHRIRRMATALPRWRWVGAVAGLAVAVGAIIGACEAPRPVEQEPGTDHRATAIGTGAPVQWGLSSRQVAVLVRLHFPELLRGRDEPVYVWLVFDAEGRLVTKGTAPRSLSDRSMSTEQGPQLVPGYDTLFPRQVREYGIFGFGSLAPNSPPVMWVRLGDGRGRDLSAFEEHPEMRVLPWIRDGISRYYPSLLRSRSPEPVDVWFIGDAQKRILRTTTTRRVPASLSIDELIQAVNPDLRRDAIAKWTVTTPHGVTSDSVRVFWIELRPGQSVFAPTQGEIPSQSAMVGWMRAAIEKYYPEYLSRAAKPRVDLWFHGTLGGRVIRSSRIVGGGFAPVGYKEIQAQLPEVGPMRPGMWFGMAYPLGPGREDVRAIWLYDGP